MDGLALPALRTKRKRRKPPGPRFWLALGFVVTSATSVAMMTFIVAEELPGPSALSGLFVLGINAWSFSRWWPVFLAELKRWREDDDE